MSRRFCLFAGGALFAAAASLAAADLWVAAGLCVSGCMYFTGRCHTARELDMAKARERRLDDELSRLHRAFRGQPHNGAGHLSPAALNDRNSNTTAVRGVPAQVRATRLP